MNSYYKFNFNGFFNDLTRTRKDLLDSFSKPGPSFTYYSKTTVPIESKNKKNNHIDSLNEKEFNKLLEAIDESIYKEKEKEMSDKYRENNNSATSEGHKELPGVSGEFHNIDFNSLGGKLGFTKDIKTVESNTPKGSLGVADKQTEHVNHPSHYNDNEIETFEMFLLFYHNQPEKIQGALIFNIFKYRDRLGKKESPGDAEKMKWYLDKFELLFPDEYELYNIYHSSKGNS